MMLASAEIALRTLNRCEWIEEVGLSGRLNYVSGYMFACQWKRT